MTKLATETEHQDDSSSSSDEDDPRVAALFQANHAAAEALPMATRPIHVSQGAIVECFQRSLATHNQPHPASGGIWKPPSLFSSSNDDDDKEDSSLLLDWKPAALPLPAWVVQPPAADDEEETSTTPSSSSQLP